jgi:transposase-like protein
MSKRYAPDHKQLVLRVFRDFLWDVTKTNAYTGIPERTLRQWRREYRQTALRSLAAAKPKTALVAQPHRP